MADATFEQKRTLVELLIDRVLVANGEVEIRYVVPTHPRSENIRFCHFPTTPKVAIYPSQMVGMCPSGLQDFYPSKTHAK